jgi:PAS domain S-box-containing protein
MKALHVQSLGANWRAARLRKIKCVLLGGSTAAQDPPDSQRLTHRLHRNTPALTATAYLILGTLWIRASDHAAAALFAVTDDLTRFQTYKGELFVAISAIALFLWLHRVHRVLKRLPFAERELHEAEEQYRNLFELSPDGIVVHKGGRIQYANPGFRRMSGLSDAQPLNGVLLTDLIDPNWRALVDEHLRQLSDEGGVTTPLELKIKGANGNAVEVKHVSSSMRVGDATVIQSHFRDLTARNQARRELERANHHLERCIQERTAELELANHALESFTYSVAHDLRAPVAHVDGFGKALEAALARGDTLEASHYAQRIVASAELMRDLIDGLLKLSRAERAQLDPQLVDCHALVQEVVNELDETQRSCVEVEPLPKIQADWMALRQVWVNVISNAVKFSSTTPSPQVRIGARINSREVVFSVADNGVGFDPAAADKLFSVFHRLPSGRSFAGTGIGLTIVKRVIERHGGRVWACSQLGQGATFSFSIPDRACR